MSRPARSTSSDALVFTGTPTELANLLEDWQRAGLSGFRLRPGTIPYDLEAITRRLVPELQQRGAFRAAYQANTLRGLLGLSRPANRYAPYNTITLTRADCSGSVTGSRPAAPTRDPLRPTLERSAPAGGLVVGSRSHYQLAPGGSVHYVGRAIVAVGVVALVVGVGMITGAFGANPGITLPVGQSVVSCPGALRTGGGTVPTRR